MEATRADSLPEGANWQFEPKWDGFRCLAFRWHDEVILQSKAGQPLTRYFPELVAAFAHLDHDGFVLDGEIVVTVGGTPSFDDLLLRIHPAPSRIAKLAEQTPAKFLAFDLLYRANRANATNGLFIQEPLTVRRAALERFFQDTPGDSLISLSPATQDRALAEQWFQNLAPLGLDGIIAKKTDEPYHSGDREAMIKIKRLKSADCVVGGFRYSGANIGSLLLGLYDAAGILHFVGHTSAFSQAQRKTLRDVLEPLTSVNPFTGRTPGGPSRWSAKRNMEWVPVKPSLVCEVRYDYFSQGRFRHGTRFLRWRPDKPPGSCTLEQVSIPAHSASSG
jgi:ATP-dependent DNA ligase